MSSLDPVTFKDWVAGLSSVEFDLGPPTKLGPDVEHFLQEPATLQGKSRRIDTSPEPAVGNYEEWVEWRGHRVHMPKWWRELVGIQDISDYHELSQKIRASFEIPWVKSTAQNGGNDYSALPTPLCICQKDSSHLWTQGSLARILGKANYRLWPTLRPSNIGPKRPTCHGQPTTPFDGVCSGFEVDDGRICGS